MYREVRMVEITEVLRLWRAGVPKKRIAARLGLDPKTVRRYVTAKNIAGSTHLATTLTRPRAWQRAARQGGGTLLPRLCSPSCARHSYASCVY